jgi:acetolactate synthase I/II/III large subunit
MMDNVREAFHIAKYEQRPVVLGIPYDLQKVEHMANQPYETSAMYQPKVGRMHPDPEIVAEAVERLAAATRPIILGGRGVLRAGARDAVLKLADPCGALLSNTLPVRGLFDDHPYGLGTTGSYFTSLGKDMYQSADVVLAVGTSLSYYVGGGHYFANACKIQLDDAPRGLRDGQKAADIYVKSDALVSVEAILAGLDKKLGVGKPTDSGPRNPTVGLNFGGCCVQDTVVLARSRKGTLALSVLLRNQHSLRHGHQLKDTSIRVLEVDASAPAPVV